MDAKLNLHVFSRLLRLPIDYFERHPAGETMHKIHQVQKVREFLTGKLLTAFLDLMTLCVLLPFLFWLNASLAWIVLSCACLIALIIMVYMRPLGLVYQRVVAAETNKAAALGETIFGIKTVKSLALEPQRKALWDERVAEAGKWRLAYGKLANWPQTIVTPIERFMSMGVILLGAYWAMSDSTGYAVGGLFAFMMLSMRVAHPLVRTGATDRRIRGRGQRDRRGRVGAEPPARGRRRLRRHAAAIRGSHPFDDVTFTYGGTKIPALDRVSFTVPAGTMLGIVGR